MGQLDMLKSWEPEQQNNQNLYGQQDLANPLLHYEYRPIMQPGYASPQRFEGNRWLMGPFAPANVDVTPGPSFMHEFLQDRLNWADFRTNAQIVTVPDRPVDQGTYNRIAQNRSGVYLQPLAVGTSHQISGSAPTTGIYTGYYEDEE